MSDIAIRVENLSKMYRIGRSRERHDSLRDALVAGVRAPLQRLRGDGRGREESDDTIWALRDVSFEVKRGEVVGIIGRNGAGKSTLLKILSRITEPTEGRAEIHGRVGSLLEVGTGFHPELTGRENVYLSGAILGMKKEEIGRRFDEIVAFSGVEQFIDTPFKRYSSGMRVRLGFAVAAHLEPEILLVDEVLAVGDAAFQRKCLGKIGDVAREGRTVLLVSHNMAAIRRLCSRAILLDEGHARVGGSAAEVVDAYVGAAQAGGTRENSGAFPAVSSDFGLEISAVRPALTEYEGGSVGLSVAVVVRARRLVHRIGVGLAIWSATGGAVAVLSPGMTGYVVQSLDGACRCVFSCADISQYLAGGSYVLEAWLSKPRVERIVSVRDAAYLSLPAKDVYGTGIAFEAAKKGPVPLKMSFLVAQPGAE